MNIYPTRAAVRGVRGREQGCLVQDQGHCQGARCPQPAGRPSRGPPSRSPPSHNPPVLAVPTKQGSRSPPDRQGLATRDGGPTQH